jgi:anaerobic magnesium-protoporphyrin IX monomethyl ester cyclase
MKSNAENNILLINGPSTSTTLINELLSGQVSDSSIYLSYPLGIMTLAGWCRQEFQKSNIIILDVNMLLHKHISDQNSAPTNIDDFLASVLEKISVIPDFVGVSITFSNGHKPCLQLCKMCKEKWPTSKIIAGGVHATTFTHRIITEAYVNYVVRGAGDVAFIDLINCLLKGQNPNHIPGVVSSMDNIDSMALPLKDTNIVPAYPYDLVDMEYLCLNESTSPLSEEGARTAMIFTSRGCPYKCTFCSAAMVHGKKVSFSNIAKVIDEIECLIDNYKINNISIMDDLFGAKKPYFYEFFDAVKKRGLVFALSIPGGLAVAIFDEDMIDTLIEHGLKAVYFPIESGSEYVQKNIIKKNVDLNKAIRLIDHAKKRGLFVGVNIVLGSPSETKEMISETQEFIRRLAVDAVSIFIAYPYPGTEMTNILLNSGVIAEGDLLEIWETSKQGFQKRPFDTKEISGQEIYEMAYDMNIEVNFFSNYNMRIGNYSYILPKLNKTITKYPFHVVALVCRAKCYAELGANGEALEDLRSIDLLIRVNAESIKLYARYKSQISEVMESINRKFTIEPSQGEKAKK